MKALFLKINYLFGDNCARYLIYASPPSIFLGE